MLFTILVVLFIFVFLILPAIAAVVLGLVEAFKPEAIPEWLKREITPRKPTPEDDAMIITETFVKSSLTLEEMALINKKRKEDEDDDWRGRMTGYAAIM
jgi:hypothetical protein